MNRFVTNAEIMGNPKLDPSHPDQKVPCHVRECEGTGSCEGFPHQEEDQERGQAGYIQLRTVCEKHRDLVS